MSILRITLIALAALGVTWAADQAVRRAALDAVPVLAQAETGRAEPVGAAGAPAEDAAGTPDAAAELSPEEVAEELARIEAAVAGAETEDLEEFTPTKPLAADLSIALPSDI